MDMDSINSNNRMAAHKSMGGRKDVLPEEGSHRGKNIKTTESTLVVKSGGKTISMPDAPNSGKTIKPFYQPPYSVVSSGDSDLGSELLSDIDSESSASQADKTFANKSLKNRELEALVDMVLPPGEDFQTASFLSGYGREQQRQVNDLCQAISEKFYNGSARSLTDLLEHIKQQDTLNARTPVRHSFLLRCAILKVSEENGTDIQSWQAFTHARPPGIQDDNFWPWLEQARSWIPEAQGAAAKYMEHTWIQALELAKQHPEQQVVAYKGGFGAGKTTHGKAEFGENFAGIVAPDRAKKVIRKALPVSHATVHTQGSDMAYKLFDGLIKMRTAGLKNQPMGAIIYDSSLSSVADVTDLLKKSEAAGKPLKVIDITRNAHAGALAVLARSIEGDAARIPLNAIISGAARDRKQRPDCMNVILASQGITGTDGSVKVNSRNPVISRISSFFSCWATAFRFTGRVENQTSTINYNRDGTDHETGAKKKTITHSYEFHCSDNKGADRQLVCTLKSGQSPVWNDQLSMNECETRLASQGLKFNTRTGRFEKRYPNEKWQDQLRATLKQPVQSLVESLSSEEAQIRKNTFSRRVLPLEKSVNIGTPANLYQSLKPEIRSVLSAEAFIKSFAPLTFAEQQKVMAKFQQSAITGIPVSYMNLPAVMALELHRAFRSTPGCWL